MCKEMVRVRVLFLKEGDTCLQSDFDGALIEEMGRDFYAEDAEDEYWRLDTTEMADALRSRLFNPTDPGVVILKPVTLVYFDLLNLNSDWHGQGGIGESIENAGLWDTFHPHLADLVAHAQTLRDAAERNRKDYDAPGVRVQFYTLWRYWTTFHSSPNGDDWDCGHDLLGVWHPADITARPLNKPQPLQNA